MSSLERKYDDIVKVEMGIKEEIIVATVVLCLTFSSWGRPMSFLQLYEMKFCKYGCCHMFHLETRNLAEKDPFCCNNCNMKLSK